MFAVVEIAGMQFEVEPNQTLNVPLLKGQPGDNVEFTNILLAGAGEDTKVGSPYLEGNVQAKILEHGKAMSYQIQRKSSAVVFMRITGYDNRGKLFLGLPCTLWDIVIRVYFVIFLIRSFVR